MGELKHRDIANHLIIVVVDALLMPIKRSQLIGIIDLILILGTGIG